MINGRNLWAFFLMRFENLSTLFFHFPVTSSRPFIPIKNMMMSPIAKAIPAVIPRYIGFRPPIANVVRTVINETEPPAENPPKNETTNSNRYAFVTPISFTSSSGLKKNKEVIRAANKTIRITNRVTFFVYAFMIG